ncbi:MAG: EamA family transporter [Firmicutes bacterium]|nr:EamA family transporter [Bacillota bacterium]
MDERAQAATAAGRTAAWKVYGAAVAYSVIIGFSFLFNKIALQVTGPVDILAHRFTAAFAALLLPALLQKVKLTYDRKKVSRILPLALFYPLLFFGFQTYGLQYVLSSEAGILLAVSPIFTLLLASLFIREKTNSRQMLSVFLSVGGVIFILVQSGSGPSMHNVKGIILILLSALSIAGYNVLARVLTREFSNLELSCLMIFLGFISFNLLALGQHLQGGTLPAFLAPLKSLPFLFAILYLGVLSTALTSLLTNYVLTHLKAAKMSVFANLGTLITVLAGIVFLEEKLFYYHFLGSLLIVAGVLGTNFLGD